MSFIYCLNTSTIQPTPLMDKIRLASEYGFAAIELWLNDVFDYLQQGGSLKDIVHALSDYGLIVPCTIAMKGWGDATPEVYPAALDECRRRMELAAELGAPYIVATPPRGPADLHVVAERYRDLLRIGRVSGVRPTMEYLGFCESVSRVDQAWDIVMAANDEQATIVLDTFHNFRGGSSIADLEKIPASRIANFHLNDAPRQPPREQQMDPDRVMPGEGILDLKGELNRLRSQGYTGCVSLELFNPVLWAKDPNDVLGRAMERMRILLG
jgi:2-keto-myo-inositol isomerase